LVSVRLLRDGRERRDGRLNLAPYGDRARVVESAVWAPRTGLTVERPSGAGAEWGVRVVAAPPGVQPDLEAIGVGDLIEESGSAAVDLVKIDIEGAEAVVFSESCDWIQRLRMIAIEFHGEDCRRSFFEAMKSYRYDLSYSGELAVCASIALRQDHPAPTSADPT
jgi:FkbM family methyltransferase